MIEKPSLDPIYIGLFGSTGAGKSSLINAIIRQAMFLPVSRESICTSCIVQVSSGCCEQYEAKIHLLSDQVRAACLPPSFSSPSPIRQSSESLNISFCLSTPRIGGGNNRESHYHFPHSRFRGSVYCIECLECSFIAFRLCIQ